MTIQQKVRGLSKEQGRSSTDDCEGDSLQTILGLLDRHYYERGLRIHRFNMNEVTAVEEAAPKLGAGHLGQITEKQKNEVLLIIDI